MKFIIFFLALFPTYTWAQDVLIRSAQAEPRSYEAYRQHHPQYLSLTTYYITQIQTSLGGRVDVFNIRPETPSEALQKIQLLRSQGPFSQEEIAFTYDLATSLETSLSSPILKDLFCWSTSLLEKTLPFCSYKTASFLEIKKVFPEIEVILQEGIKKEGLSEISFDENSSYQWTLLSNAHHPIYFWGTYQQLINQRFEFIPIITGQCDAFNVHSSDLQLQTQASTFFPDNCVRSHSRASMKNEFRKESNAALWFGGALLLGGLTYLLKDKRITLDVLSF